MKKVLASDNALKIISVLIAICIWMYVAIVMDTTVEVTVRDLPVQFVGQDTLNSKGLAVIRESATSVTVKVKGSRRKMGNNDMKTIIAKVDVSNVSGEGVYGLPVEVVVPFESQGVSSQSLYSIDVRTEKLVEKTLDIRIHTSGTLAQSYMSGDITANPGKVTIKGPESAVEQISQAAVNLDYGGADVDIDAKLPISFYGDEGKEVSAFEAILGRITADSETTEVHCPVLKIREVSPSANFDRQGLPDGVEYNIEPSVLYVYGEDPIAAKVTEIETEEIPVDRLLDNEKIKVKLRIPNGVKILYDVSEVEISVKSE